MELITYKTNISSEAAASRVASLLNTVISPANWQLDLRSADRHLTVFSPGVVDEVQVRNAIRKAGYRAQVVENIYSIY